MDIEDLRAFGERRCACPWFLSRAAAKEDGVEVLFLPYNYLLDRSARGSLGIDWMNDIVIIDEAHNLESVCMESMSFDLSAGVRRACDSELGALIEHAVRPGGLVIPALEDLAKTEKGLESVIGSENCEINEIRLMRTILVALEEFVANIRLDRGEGGDVSFGVYAGSRLRTILEEAGGPTADTYQLFLEMLDRAMGIQADKSKPPSSASNAGPVVPGSKGNSGNAITVLQTAIRVLFESMTAGHENVFRTVIQMSNTKPEAGRTVSYWCFKPAIAMKSIHRLNMRCMLLTSGTLSPMDSFATELGLDFPVRLENPHVVTKPQVWAGVIKTGPDHEGVQGRSLSSAYYQRGDASHMELGRSMIKLASLIPDGMLVFFPSYSLMYSSIEAWKRLGPGVGGQKPSVWEHLLRFKRIIAEERESSKFAAAILAHRTNVDAGAGSILLAVCRGKVSEGIDFSDEYGRAVVITGLPYPSAFDPKVVLKREIADEEARANHKNNTSRRLNSGVISGSEWYNIQALRAVNQAVGRAIRHKYDYGAIILCDERFQSKQLQQQISKWIRPNLGVCPSFHRAENSLGSFFTNAVQSSFAKEGDQKRLEARKRHQENAALRKPEEDTAAVLVAQQTIRDFLPAPKTEEQFLAQVMSMSEELESLKKGKKKEKQSTSVSKKLDFSFGTETAKSERNDSGAMRDKEIALQTEKENGNEKWSTAFLAKRAKRQESQDGTNLNGTQRMQKRVRLTPKVNAPPAAKVALSQRIKMMFSNKEEVREFLKLFREVMRLDSVLKDGAGPLASDAEIGKSRKEAEHVVQKVVAFVKNRGVERDQKEFLEELRSKIPGGFCGWYDVALYDKQA